MSTAEADLKFRMTYRVLVVPFRCDKQRPNSQAGNLGVRTFWILRMLVQETLPHSLSMGMPHFCWIYLDRPSCLVLELKKTPRCELGGNLLYNSNHNLLWVPERNASSRPLVMTILILRTQRQHLSIDTSRTNSTENVPFHFFQERC
jgi:hypothetical protein